MNDFLSENAKAEIEEKLRAGEKILAIKLYREHTGLGLKEAKEAVESMEAELAAGGVAASGQSGGDPAESGDLNRERIEDLIRSGEKIKAIRLHRQWTGMGLKESKEAVEVMEADLRRAGWEPGKGGGPSKDTEPIGGKRPVVEKGCMVVLTLAVVVAAVVLASAMFFL